MRGGGHHLAGTALADGGLTIDLSLLRDVRVDRAARTAVVGGGCRLGDVDRATQEHGLATPLGFISKVGVGGLTLGGGLGYLTRRFGWTVDNLLEVEIVTAAGDVPTASRDENADLFWGVRGAGANLGVVTRLTYRLHPVGPTVYGGLVAWPFEWSEKVFAAYRQITANAPRELAVWLNLLTAPPAPFVPPPGTGGGSARWPSVTAATPVPPPPLPTRSGQSARRSSTCSARCPTRRCSPTWTTRNRRDALLLAGRIPEHARRDGARDAARAVRRVPDARGGRRAAHRRRAQRARRGRRRRRQPRRPLRGRCQGHVAAGRPGRRAAPAWVRAAHERIRPYGTGRIYVNFQTADEPDARIRAAYGSNYARLAEIKARYDPDNLFRSNRNVRPQARTPQARSRDGSAWTGSPSTRVARTRAPAMGPDGRVERVAVQHGQVGQLAGGDRAGLGLQAQGVGRAGGEGVEGGRQVEPLVGQERLAVGVVGGDPAHGDLDLLQGVGGRHRPVAAEGQHRPGAAQAGPRVLPAGPLGLQERPRQLAHVAVEAGPERLGVGHHPEAAEPGAVVGVDELEVGDLVAGVAAAVGGGRGLEGVEGVADGPVADGVDVHVEGLGVQGGDHAASSSAASMPMPRLPVGRPSASR